MDSGRCRVQKKEEEQEEHYGLETYLYIMHLVITVTQIQKYC